MAAVFIGIAAAYWALASRWYATADGATRPLAVQAREQLFLHGNNHLLFPVAHYAWKQAGIAVGINNLSHEQYLHFATGLNSLAAAVSLWIFFLTVRRLSGDRTLTILATLLYGTSYAFLLHATLPAEPMLAIPLFWGAFYLATCSHGSTSRFAAVLSALLTGLALWFYEGFLVLIPAIALTAMLGSFAAQGFSAAVRRGVLWSAVFGVSALVTYGVAHALVGNSIAPQVLLSRMLALDGGGRWSAVKLSDALSPVIYGGSNLFGITDFPGVRNCLAHPWHGTSLAYFAATGAWLVMLGAAIALHATGFRQYSRERRFELAAIAAGVCFSLAGPISWMGHYDKLWILPLGFTVLALTTGIAWQRGSADAVVPRRSLAWLLVAFVVLVGGANLTLAVRRHFSDDPAYTAAQEAAAAVGPADLVLVTWDPPSTYFGVAYSGPAETFTLPDEWARAKDNAAEFDRALREAVHQAHRRGGDVLAIDALSPYFNKSEFATFGAYTTPEMSRLRAAAQTLHEWKIRVKGVPSTLTRVPNESLTEAATE